MAQAPHAKGSLATKAHGPAILDIGASAFPYDGTVPDSGGMPFLQKDVDGRLFHDAPRGGRLFADKTYADPRSLLYVPSHFDPRAPAALVLFLHGNLATLARDVVRRQHVPEQVEASRLNVVLVAPQLSVDALDSSAGHFWQQGFLQNYLRNAGQHLAALSEGRFRAADIDRLPVIIVAYSGGYLSTAFSLEYARGDSHSRIVGVVLLDALFGEEPKFADWLIARHAQSFFVSAYSRSSAALNAKLEHEALAQGVTVLHTLPPRIRPGDIVFVPALGAVHNDFVTQAFVRNPLRDLLSRIDLRQIDATRDEGMPAEDRGARAFDGGAPRDADDHSGAALGGKRIDSACPVDAPDCEAGRPPDRK